MWQLLLIPNRSRKSVGFWRQASFDSQKTSVTHVACSDTVTYQAIRHWRAWRFHWSCKRAHALATRCSTSVMKCVRTHQNVGLVKLINGFSIIISGSSSYGLSEWRLYCYKLTPSTRIMKAQSPSELEIAAATRHVTPLPSRCLADSSY